MNRVLVRAIMSDPITDFEPLMEVDVTADTVKKLDDDHIEREIVGTIHRRRQPQWDRFMPIWFAYDDNPAVLATLPPYMRPAVVDGRKFNFIRGLMIRHDFYGIHSFIHLDGDVVRLKLYEMFSGTLEEYRDDLAQRNERIDAKIARFEAGNLTFNDCREIMGLPRNPQFERPADAEVVQKLMLSRDWKNATRNTIV